MKQSEEDYLNKLFASSSDVTDEVEVDLPLVDVPIDLSSRLNSIADGAPLEASSANLVAAKWGVANNWTKVTGLAASLFVAVLGFQFYQQHQTFKQLEKAQADLATALEYLGEANRIARSQVIDSFNGSMQKAGLEPAYKIGRNVMQGTKAPKLEQPEQLQQTQRQSL